MMEKYGLKRPPLSPLSSSSIREGQRRRIPANESSDGYGSRVCKENLHPNLTAQISTPGESVLTVENEYNYVREGCLSHGKVMHVRESRNRKNSSHSKPRADYSLKASLSGNRETRLPLRISNKNSQANSGTSFGTTQDFCTPSQRRLRDVDLSAVTHRTPLARLIEMQSSKHTWTGRFQIPASNILPRSVHDPKASAQHLRNHVHQRKAHTGVDGSQLTHKQGVSQSGKDDNVTVIVPEPGQLGVKIPGWFQSDSQRGVRNLMESFNSACTTEAGTSATPGARPMTGNNSSQTEEGGTSARLDENFDGAEGDEAVQDEDCRVHYVHNDLSDTKEAKPDLWDGYMDLGPPTSVCRKCNSIM
ncbi:hypothetical protein ACET3Z_026118 [Daucus carota]